MILTLYQIERGDVATKTAALKKVMYQMLNGEKMPSILMTIIRFVLPMQDHTIKKLLLIFWEIVPKTGQDGKLLHEMILVCDAYRKDLEHPNEYIRGSTLRFLCKLKVNTYHSFSSRIPMNAKESIQRKWLEFFFKRGKCIKLFVCEV